MNTVAKQRFKVRAIVLTVLAVVIVIVDLIFGSTTGIALPKDSVLADAMAIEAGAIQYCSEHTCTEDMYLTFDMLRDYVEGIDESYYDLDNNDGKIVRYDNGKFRVSLEAAGTGEYEFKPGLVPSESSTEQVVKDNN